MRKTRRRIRWSRVFLLLFVLAALTVSLAGAALYAYNAFFAAPVTARETPVPGSSLPSADKLNKRVNVLLLGIDDGDPETPGAPRRSDTMMVASVNPDDGTVSLLSIPRDTRVIIPGHKGYDKITHAFAYGGPQLAVRTVEQLLSIPINYYVVVDWRGFIKLMIFLGGVDLYVESNMDYEDPYAGLKIHLDKGYQHLDGQKAGQYVRFRHDELGDIGRVQRQQRFLKALANEMLQVGTIFKLPALVSTIDQYVETDMSLFTMIRLANSLKGLQAGGMRTEVLPGNFATIDGLSFWVADKEQTKQIVEKMFSAQTTKVGQLPTH
ncbi:cell envelope-related transcriptional attenuator [Thermosinus carboxydivorans Nor1]|uniref:Cell envelope-related transcriptional attenuator n=1 Tax=Thermosinus carboxydivorans Nor1 TaxID=401526 RepID=A1HNX6_9FIRM|nr:LCP family protein [Thermosinus carboxydivorans]EAX48084.1 cell envelope-related transcriptional attenuator [Thermosinus carboxydivorans Nor1]